MRTSCGASADIFGLHPLALEDVLNNHQRSKVEQYGDHLFIVARMLEGGMTMDSDQLGMFLGKNFIVTFQHPSGDCFDPLRERIRRRARHPAHLRARLPGLCHSRRRGRLVLSDPGSVWRADRVAGRRDHRHIDGDLIAAFHDVKSKLLILRRAIWPLRDALHMLVRDPMPLIQDDTRVYLRDCADHTFQIIDLVETYRELTTT